MENCGLLSFYSGAFHGWETTKESLFLFNKVIISSTENALNKQIEIFSESDAKVKTYLNNHLIPLSKIKPEYSEYIDLLLDFFGKYHYENWLQPYFEEEIGEFIDQSQAEISWYHSVKAYSLEFSNILFKSQISPIYLAEDEYDDLKGVKKKEEGIIESNSFADAFDPIFPDPTCLEWPELVELFDDPEIFKFRDTLWQCISDKQKISHKYIDALERFFTQNFSDEVLKSNFLEFGEAAIGALNPLYGPFKALYSSSKRADSYNRFSWIKFLQRIKRQASETNIENDFKE